MFSITLFRSGDRETFKYVYEKYAKQLSEYLEKAFRNIRDTEREDVVVNSLYKLFKNRERFENIEHIQRYLFVCIRNECIDVLRKRAHEREMKAHFRYTSSEEDQSVDTIDYSSILDEHVLKLPNQQRRIILLSYYKKIDKFKVASLLGVNSQTVLNHRTKAMIKLREIIPGAIKEEKRKRTSIMIM